MRPLLCSLLLSFAAHADPPIHLSLSAGAGNAYDFLGARAELRVRHFALFAAIGPFAFTEPSPLNGGQEHCPGPYEDGNRYGDSSFAFGGRGYLRPSRSTPYLGLQASFRGTCIGGLTSDGDPPGFHNFLTFAATLGYRFRAGPLFFDAGAGPAFTLERYGYPGRNGVAQRQVQPANGFSTAQLGAPFHPVSVVLAFFEVGVGVELF